MAVATGCLVRSSSASIACAATSRASRSPSAPILSGFEPAAVTSRTEGLARTMKGAVTPTEIGSDIAYTREIRAGIERTWENVLDWEHLPALHELYFTDVALIESGSWGWRVELTKAPGTADRRMLVELQIDRVKARYWVRTVAGDGGGSEIWAIGPQRTAIQVRLYLPERRPERLA